MNPAQRITNEYMVQVILEDVATTMSTVAKNEPVARIVQQIAKIAERPEIIRELSIALEKILADPPERDTQEDLTDEQIERQDFLQNSVYDLVNHVADRAGFVGGLAWNIEWIGPLSDHIANILEQHTTLTEMDVYPYMEEE